MGSTAKVEAEAEAEVEAEARKFRPYISIGTQTTTVRRGAGNRKLQTSMTPLTLPPPPPLAPSLAQLGR